MPSTALPTGCRAGIIGLALGAEGFAGGGADRAALLGCRVIPSIAALPDVGSSVRTRFKIGRLDVFGTKLLLGAVGVTGSGRGGGETNEAAFSSGTAVGGLDDGATACEAGGSLISVFKELGTSALTDGLIAGSGDGLTKLSFESLDRSSRFDPAGFGDAEVGTDVPTSGDGGV